MRSRGFQDSGTFCIAAISLSLVVVTWSKKMRRVAITLTGGMVQDGGQRDDEPAHYAAGLVGASVLGNLKTGADDSVDARLIDLSNIIDIGKVGQQTGANGAIGPLPA